MTIASIVKLLIIHRYLMLLILALIEGPLVCMGAGIMVSLGYFSLIPAFALVIVGDIVPNSVSFFLGRLSNRGKTMKKILSKLNVTEKHFEMLEKFWATHTNKTMFLSKLAWGLGVPLFMSAGMTTLSFRKFLASMTWIAIVQYAIVIAIGYFLASSYASLSASNKVIEIVGLVVSGIIFVAILFSLSRFARRKILEEK